MHGLILLMMLPVTFARLFYDYNALDPFILTGDALVKKILAGRLFPTRAVHIATKHLDTTVDAPTIYVDERRTTLLSTEKQTEEYTGFAHQSPTRSRKHIITDTAFVKTTERKFSFPGNPSINDYASIVFTKGAEWHGDKIDTDVTVYDEARHAFPEQLHGVTPLPSRTPEVTSIVGIATKHVDTTTDELTIYVDDRRTTLLSTEKQTKEYTGFAHQSPTRSRKHIITDTAFVKTTEREFSFPGNPSINDHASIVTKGAEWHVDKIDTDVTVYDEARHVFPEQLHGLTPLSSRTSEVTSIVGRDWYAALRNAEVDGHAEFPEPVFRVLTRQSSTHSDTKAPGTWKKIRDTTTTTKRTRRRIRKKTTTTTTPISTTPPCTDDMGYRVRCTNSTTSTTSTSTTTTTTTTTTTPSTTIMADNDTTSSTEEDTTFSTTVTTTTTEPTTPTLSDIDKLLSILDNLTYIYETDGLVEKFNKTLQAKGYPYCHTTESTESSTTMTTDSTWKVDNLTGSVTTKCYVCGLDAEGIPLDSNCADAFASDFFPMAPVDFTSRRFMDHYKKQCRYMDMPKWHVNGTRGRAMWGKWTGGCSVRWLDISGVYTQRTCRNRHRPTLGRHFASKRMAKLEWALFREQNGCIISPQASLVPFSRGVSLYARFHACVCTGNYCNRAERISTLCTWLMIGFSLIMVYCSNDCRLEGS